MMRTYKCSSRHPMAEKARKRFRKASEERYMGFSNKVVQRYAEQTTYLVITDDREDEIVAGLGIIDSMSGGVRRSLPFEDAEPCIRVPESKGRMVEFTAFWFDRQEHVVRLFRDAAAWTLARGVTMAIAIYDPQNPASKMWTVGISGFIPWPEKAITYDSFRAKATGKSVLWVPAFADRRILTNTKRRLENLLGPSEPVIDLDLTEPCHRPARFAT
jgi:hypothetical protein